MLVGVMRVAELALLTAFETVPAAEELTVGDDGREDEVAALKAEGLSVRAIAAELGISVGSVHGMVKAPAGVG